MNKWRNQLAPEEYQALADLLADCPLLEHWSDAELSLEPASKDVSASTA